MATMIPAPSRATRDSSLRKEASGLDFPVTQAIAAEVERSTVDRARTGDQNALADLYDWYMPRVYRYTLARVGHAARAGR